MTRKTLLMTMSAVLFLFGTTASAALIFDNTPNPGKPGIITNLRTGSENQVSGCTRDQALYQKQCNSFSISDIEVMQSSTAGDLTLERGAHNVSSTSYNNSGKDSELKYFADGQHLFDIDKMRRAADAISRLAPRLPAFSYGTITFEQFIDNVANGTVMYGIVRVLVPLENKGPGRNALDQPAPKVYGFCGSPEAHCGCAPHKDTQIIAGAKVCGRELGRNARISVRGTLLIDFVDHATGKPVSLENLPFAPRDIYFKVEVPISVNPANDANDDGRLDNLDAVAALSISKSCPTAAANCSIPVPLTGQDQLFLSDVPQESRDQFAYQYGTPLTAAVFSALPAAQQYHLLMPSGYEKGWLEAFGNLGISPDYWRELGFNPGTSNSRFALEDIRSDAFEDVPAYVYTGGLVDMNYHVNISGLVYVPQAIELEQKRSEVRQYICGAILVRDAFFLEEGGGITLISSNASTFSQITVTNGMAGTFVTYTKQALKGKGRGPGSALGKGSGKGVRGGVGFGVGGTPPGKGAAGGNPAGPVASNPAAANSTPGAAPALAGSGSVPSGGTVAGTPAAAGDAATPVRLGPQAVEIRPQFD